MAACGRRASCSSWRCLVLTAIGFLVIPPLVSQVTRLHQRRAGLHRRPHRGTWAARLPPGGVPDRRPHSRGDREARARGRARSEPTGRRHRAQRRDGGRRDVTVIFLTFFMLLEGPRTLERLLDLLPRSHGRATARRARHLQDDLRLRHRQPRSSASSPGRWRRSCCSPSGASSRSRSACSSPSSTSSRSRERRSRPSSCRPSCSSSRLGPLPHRHRFLHRLPAVREPRAPAARLRADGAALATHGALCRTRRGATRGHSRCAPRDPRRGLALAIGRELLQYREELTADS